MSRSACLLLLRVAFLVLLTDTALAQRVVLVRPPPGDTLLVEAFGRLRAELALQSFDVLVLDAPGDLLDPGRLERETQRHEAFAAIALRRHAGDTAAAVWLVDRLTGKTSVRRLSIDASRDGPTLLAIRAVDLLRASLLELDGRPPPADVLGVERSAPAPEVVHFARKPRPFQLGVGGAALGTPALGAAFGVSLSARYRPVRRLAVGLQFAGPALGGELRTPSGSASVRQELAFAFATWNLAPASVGGWEWGPRLGVGAAHLLATGNVEPPLVARTSDTWSFAARGGLGTAFLFTDALSLEVDATCLALVPQPVVAVHTERSSPLALQALLSVELIVGF